MSGYLQITYLLGTCPYFALAVQQDPCITALLPGLARIRVRVHIPIQFSKNCILASDWFSLSSRIHRSFELRAWVRVAPISHSWYRLL
jgi:hypothetical protein